MTGEIPTLTEEKKTDKAIRNVIFRIDRCRVRDRVTEGRLD